MSLSRRDAKKFHLYETYPKKFFFWGMFKNPDHVRNILGEPRKMVPTTLGNTEGLLVDFSNLSDDEFFKLLGYLAIVELNYPLRLHYLDNGDNVFVYVPIDHFNSRKNKYTDHGERMFFRKEC